MVNITEIYSLCKKTTINRYFCNKANILIIACSFGLQSELAVQINQSIKGKLND